MYYAIHATMVYANLTNFPVTLFNKLHKKRRIV